MKKMLIWIFIFTFMFLSVNSLEAAGRQRMKTEALQDLTTSTVVTNTYLMTGEVWRSEGIKINDCSGDLSFIINLSDSSDVDVDWKYSMDDSNYFIPYNDDKTAIDCDIDNLTENSMIQITAPIQANYIRFDLDADGESGFQGGELIKQIEQ